FPKSPGVLDGKDVFQFNLSSIQESEVILHALFISSTRGRATTSDLGVSEGPAIRPSEPQHPYFPRLSCSFYGCPQITFCNTTGEPNSDSLQERLLAIQDVTAVGENSLQGRQRSSGHGSLTWGSGQLGGSREALMAKSASLQLTCRLSCCMLMIEL
ncbi:hypothetical protein FQN60_000096, partial [Etheostoma spectabile]